MKTTRYFEHVRTPRRWARIAEANRVLRVILLQDFADTDTALLECTDNPVAETKEISEHIYADLDRDGNLVSMTVEHARTNARLDEFAYQEVLRRT